MPGAQQEVHIDAGEHVPQEACSCPFGLRIMGCVAQLGVFGEHGKQELAVFREQISPHEHGIPGVGAAVLEIPSCGCPHGGVMDLHDVETGVQIKRMVMGRFAVTLVDA